MTQLCFARAIVYLCEKLRHSPSTKDGGNFGMKQFHFILANEFVIQNGAICLRMLNANEREKSKQRGVCCRPPDKGGDIITDLDPSEQRIRDPSRGALR